MVRTEIIFVILHYLTIEDTKDCIESIQKNYFNEDFKIIVVNNQKQEISLNTKIIIINIGENLGFAKGNNLGIEYARRNFDFDYIITCNNDVIFNDKKMFQKIENDYERTNFDLLGPSIIGRDKLNQNPHESDLLSIKKVDKEIRYLKGMKVLKTLRIDKIYFKIKIKKYKNINKGYKTKILHGACIIFSRKFINKFNGFFSQTFLYHEEDFIELLVKIAHLKRIFDLDIIVNHKEDSSTDFLLGTGVKKFRFKANNEIKSLKLLRSGLMNNNIIISDMSVKKLK